MKLLSFVLCATILFLSTSCKKILGERHDWQIVDAAGNDIMLISNKTEAELLACTTCGSINGSQPGAPLGQTLTSCNYYNVADPKFCWVAGTKYLENMSDKFVHCFFASDNPYKVTCGTCGAWLTRRKMTYVPGNTTTYSPIVPRRVFCGDTATAFNSGAQYVIKNTADSLVLLQYSKEGSVWH